jgi:hypothetical protein
VLLTAHTIGKQMSGTKYIIFANDGESRDWPLAMADSKVEAEQYLAQLKEMKKCMGEQLAPIVKLENENREAIRALPWPRETKTIGWPRGQTYDSYCKVREEFLKSPEHLDYCAKRDAFAQTPEVLALQAESLKINAKRKEVEMRFAKIFKTDHFCVHYTEFKIIEAPPSVSEISALCADLARLPRT